MPQARDRTAGSTRSERAQRVSGGERGRRSRPQLNPGAPTRRKALIHEAFRLFASVARKWERALGAHLGAIPRDRERERPVRPLAHVVAGSLGGPGRPACGLPPLPGPIEGLQGPFCTVEAQVLTRGRDGGLAGAHRAGNAQGFASSGSQDRVPTSLTHHGLPGHDASPWNRAALLSCPP